MTELMVIWIVIATGCALCTALLAVGMNGQDIISLLKSALENRHELALARQAHEKMCPRMTDQPRK